MPPTPFVRWGGLAAILGGVLGIDDFGMGYSSLSYLQHFAITTVTLDRSFVSGSTTNPNDAAITTAIIALAQKLTLQVVAEGVETADQVNFVWEPAGRCDPRLPVQSADVCSDAHATSPHRMHVPAQPAGTNNLFVVQ